MKYRLLKELPFMKPQTIFGKGCWVGGGWGVDKGNDNRGAHNGIQTFEQYENKMLDSLILNKEWVKMIPETCHEVINLYEEKYIRKDELLNLIKMVD